MRLLQLLLQVLQALPTQQRIQLSSLRRQLQLLLLQVLLRLLQLLLQLASLLLRGLSLCCGPVRHLLPFLHFCFTLCMQRLQPGKLLHELRHISLLLLLLLCARSACCKVCCCCRQLLLLLLQGSCFLPGCCQVLLR
jgi:hypothetical protein